MYVSGYYGSRERTSIYYRIYLDCGDRDYGLTRQRIGSRERVGMTGCLQKGLSTDAEGDGFRTDVCSKNVLHLGAGQLEFSGSIHSDSGPSAPIQQYPCGGYIHSQPGIMSTHPAVGRSIIILCSPELSCDHSVCRRVMTRD